MFQEYTLDDVNFDGYLDFGYLDSRGLVNSYYCFWIWNPKLETFINSKELAIVSMPSFDKKCKVVTGYCRNSAASNTTTYYKYILTCVRILDMGQPNKESYQVLIVQDYIDDKLVEVFKKKTIINDKYEGIIYDEFFKWHDLNYK